MLVTWGVDTTVHVWDALKGSLTQTLRGHSAVADGVALSKDGRLIASCGDDGAVKLVGRAEWRMLTYIFNDRLYQRMDITGLAGVTDIQRDALLALGAFEGSAARA